MNTLTALLQAIASFFGWAKARSDERNTDAMKKAQMAQIEVDFKNEAEKAVAERNTDEIRKMLAD